MDGRDGRTAGTDGRQGRTAGTDGRDRRRDQGMDGRQGRTAGTDRGIKGVDGRHGLMDDRDRDNCACFTDTLNWLNSSNVLVGRRQTFSTVARIWLLSGGDAINPSEQIANEPAACPRGHLETTNFVIRCCV
ncbi:uncharacterized protein LOC144088668 isoform X14 [Stigmatopora argus]